MITARQSKHGHRSAGFSLLEVLLALILMVALLGVMTIAIQVTLKATNTGRSDVAQAQLARALMRRIADDVRGAVYYEPVTSTQSAASATSGVDASAAAGALTGSGSSGSSSSSGGVAATAGTATASTATSAFGSETEDATATVVDPLAPATAPGLYGGLNALEVDVVRIPNTTVSSLEPVMEGDMLLPPPLGGVLTVSYEVIPPLGGVDGDTMAMNASATGAPTALGLDGRVHTTGLVRRESVRSIANWAYENGSTEIYAQDEQLLAPEVVSLEFWYFDGTSWLDYWDSSTQAGLPLAVEIVLTLADAEALEINPYFQQGMGGTINVYRTTVYMPGSTLLETPPETTTDTTATDDGGTF